MHVVQCLIVLGVGEHFGVDAEDLADVDVGAVGVDLGVVGVKRRVLHPVHLFDPGAGARRSSAFARMPSTASTPIAIWVLQAEIAQQAKGIDVLVRHDGVHLCAVLAGKSQANVLVRR